MKKKIVESSKVIYIDAEVYKALCKYAGDKNIVFKSPNYVLRKILAID